VTLVAVCLLLGAVLGPMIAYAVKPISSGCGPTPRPLAQTGARLLLWGAGAGGALGGVAGLLMSISTYLPDSEYLPDAPMRAAEGAALGAASGIVLCLLFEVAALLPRLRMRR
jgi:hypothetical protein